MAESLRVSAVIPCFNGAEFIAEAIASIRRQTVPVNEIIVIDDGSTDGSAAVLRSLAAADLHCYTQLNQGLPAARNAGVDRCRGDVITFLDHDDLWCENKIEIQLGLLAAHPELGIVVGQMQKLRQVAAQPGGRRFEPYDPPTPALSMNGAVIRREVFGIVGRFDTSQRYCDDWDWYMRARELGVGMRLHDDVVHYYRRHERNMTNNVELGNQHTLQMLKKSLERRRKQQGEARSLPSLLDRK